VTLVDTSVWIDHLRSSDKGLTALLDDAQVLSHPFVIGELALGRLAARSEVLELLGNLPSSPMVGDVEMLSFIDAHGLAGSGLGWVDAHLLASAKMAGERLWTRDRRLAQAARKLGVAA
jgi:predicted nucleic acid-binding protein